MDEHPLLHIPVRVDPNVPPNTIRIDNPDGSHLFSGMTIPETEAHAPAPRHDGILARTVGSRVSYHEAYAVRGQMAQGIRIEGRYADGSIDDATLMPDEALSLLAWLLQEQSTLEKLAKEQQ